MQNLQINHIEEAIKLYECGITSSYELISRYQELLDQVGAGKELADLMNEHCSTIAEWLIDIYRGKTGVIIPDIPHCTVKL